MTMEKPKDFTKAAKLVLALGPEYSKNILKFLSDEEVKSVVKEVVNLGEISTEERMNIIKEFTDSVAAGDERSTGGFNAAKDILNSVYDTKKADEMIAFLNPNGGPFKFIEDVEADKISEALKSESPQVIAVVVAFISPGKGAQILSSLGKELRAEVARRVGIIEKSEPDAELINGIIAILKDRFVQKKEVRINGLEKLIKIMHEVGKKEQKEILDLLDKDDPAMAALIKKELFRFEDLKSVEDRYLQRILREVEGKDLTLALKGVPDELKEKIFKNMSERGAEMIKDDIEAMGPLKRAVVEEAQQKILGTVRKLEANGEIVLEGGNPDVVV
jgi:flagellar motor switch protein FliG